MKKLKRYTHEIVKELANNYTTKREFEKANKSAYNYCNRHKIINDLGLRDSIIIWNKEELFKHSKTCSNRTDFSKKFSGGYHYAINNNLLDDIFPLKNDEVKEMELQDEIIYLINLSKRFKTISEFRLSHPKEYQRIHYLKIQEKCFSQMSKRKISLPEEIMKFMLLNIFHIPFIENSRKILNGLELDVFYPEFNLAFEYNGHYWHRSKNYTDNIKTVQCEKMNITLITIEEPEKRFSNYKNLELFVKNQIINNLQTINKILNCVVRKDDILNVKIDYNKIYSKCFQFNEITNAITNCKTQKEFRQRYRPFYNYLCKTNQLFYIKDLKKLR